MKWTFDFVNIAISILSLLGVILSVKMPTSKLGPISGMIGSSFWLVIAMQTAQGGILVSSLCFMLFYVYLLFKSKEPHGWMRLFFINKMDDNLCTAEVLTIPRSSWYWVRASMIATRIINTMLTEEQLNDLGVVYNPDGLPCYRTDNKNKHGVNPFGVKCEECVHEETCSWCERKNIFSE